MNTNPEVKKEVCVFTCTPKMCVLAALGYMAMSVSAFLIGWFECYVSLPVLACLWYSIWKLARKKDIVHEEGWQLSIKDVVQWGLFVVFAGACLYATGICGGVETHPDYSSFRYACYHNLIDAPWPVVLPNGREFSYYVSGLCVPAMCSRLSDSQEVQQWILFVWALVPIVLAFTLMFVQMRRVSWLLVAIGLLLLTPFERECSVEWVAKAYNVACFHLFGDEWNARYICGRLLGMGNNLPALLATSVPMLVCVLVVVYKQHVAYVVPLAVSMLACISPIGAVAIFPVALMVYVQGLCNRKFTWRQAIIGCVLPVAMSVLWLLYFARSESETYIGPVWGIWKWESFMAYYIPAQVFLLVLTGHLCWKYRRNAAFMVVLLLLYFVPWVYMGSQLKHGGYNELWFKGESAYVVVLAYYLVRAWKELPKVVRLLWLSCAVIPLCAMWNTFSRFDANKNVEDKWNGHLYHPGYHFLNQSTPPCKDPALSGILLRKGGASEWQFPGMILPKAPGCDYTRPVVPEK